MEAQISAGMKTPVLSHRPGPEGSAGDKGRKRESNALSRTQSTERDEQVTQTLCLTVVCIVAYSTSVSKNKHLFSCCCCILLNIHVYVGWYYHW